MKQNREDLKHIISKLYAEPLENKEVEEACDNLINLFNELIDIDKEVSKND
jgi:hypothetical protein